jgi:putative transcriptional regulator
MVDGWLRVLRALDVLDQLDAFLPDPGISPLQLVRMQGRERQRASGRRRMDDKGAE